MTTNVDDKKRKIEKTISYPVLLRNTLFGWRSGERNISMSFAYFIKGLTRELHIAPSFFLRWYLKAFQRDFEKTWLKEGPDGPYYDFQGAKVPKSEEFPLHVGIFQDTFYFYCLFNDNYDSKIIHQMDSYLNEGPYGYTSTKMDVNVKEGDIVIDAGSWIGDFSALAAAKGAKAYAFEPSSPTYSMLLKTIKINDTDKIIPVKKALGATKGSFFLSYSSYTEAHSIVFSLSEEGEEVETTTLDAFVEENNLERVDFIKADIEGAERDLLQGAKNTLKKFAPKLALCTYHRPDDPEVLEKLILEANPNYTVVHLRKKLFAQVLS